MCMSILMQHWLLQCFTNTDLCSNVMFILCGLWTSTFPHDALRVIGLSRVIACGALYLESQELFRFLVNRQIWPMWWWWAGVLNKWIYLCLINRIHAITTTNTSTALMLVLPYIRLPPFSWVSVWRYHLPPMMCMFDLQTGKQKIKLQNYKNRNSHLLFKRVQFWISIIRKKCGCQLNVLLVTEISLQCGFLRYHVILSLYWSDFSGTPYTWQLTTGPFGLFSCTLANNWT